MSATGIKALVEATGSSFQAGSTATVNLAGAESTIKGTATTFRSNGALVVSASAGTSKGLVELSGPSGLLQGSSVAVRSSTGAGDFGTLNVTLNVTLNTVRATAGAATIAAGLMRAVTVKESTLSATTLARASTGLGGVCLAELNAITAPVQSMCL